MKGFNYGGGARIFTAIAGAAILLTQAGPLAAADYPSRYITVINPQPVGGTTDVIARLVTDEMSKSLGQSLVTENVVGGSQVIATDRLVKSPPDGYTLEVATNFHTALPFLVSAFKLDPIKDFTPICTIDEGPLLLIINGKLPVSNFTEFVAYTKAHPKDVKFAHYGGQGELDMLAFFKIAGLDMIPVAYEGAPQAAASVVSGETQVYISSWSFPKPYLLSGELKAIATSSRNQIDPELAFPAVQDLPVIGHTPEAPGYFGGSGWRGLMGPSGMPAPVVEKLAQACVAAVKSDTVSKRLKEMGFKALGLGPEETAAFWQTEYEATKSNATLVNFVPR